MTNFATKKNLSSSKNKKNISFKIFDQNFDLVKKTRKGILKCCLYSRSAAAEKIFFIIFERIERERERERREREKATFIINRSEFHRGGKISTINCSIFNKLLSYC